MTTKQQIGRALQSARKQKNISQQELKDLSKLTANQISNIENGKSNPTINTLERIAEVLDKEIVFSLNDKNELV